MNLNNLIQHQISICNQFKSPQYIPMWDSKLGVALNVKSNLEPINGMRSLPENGTNGWFIWAGEEFNYEPDFFKPLHAIHLIDWCPHIIKFLGLAPGWRFLIADGYEDVWFDENLLENDI